MVDAHLVGIIISIIRALVIILLVEVKVIIVVIMIINNNNNNDKDDDRPTGCIPLTWAGVCTAQRVVSLPTSQPSTSVWSVPFFFCFCVRSSKK